MATAAVLSVAGPVVGGLIGHFSGAGDRKRAQQAMSAALSEINAVGAPPDLSAEIIREKFKQVGLLTPEFENKIDVGISKIARITEDETLRKAQIGALHTFEHLGQTGLGATDRAAIDKLRSELDQQVQGQQQQIQQNLQARGQAGGGAELAARLQTSQSGANRASSAGLEIAGNAQERALQAMIQSANLGGDLRRQDLNFETTTKGAADELRKFDITNQIVQQERNVGRQQRVQELNLAEQQRIQDQNATNAYNEKLRQAEAKRNYFNDKLSLAQAKSNALTGQAANYRQQAAASGKLWGGIGAGIGQAAGGIYAADALSSAKKAGGAATGNEVYGSGTGRIYGSKLGGVGGP